MKNSFLKKTAFLFFATLLLNSCDTLKKGLGIDKDVPDEFLIKKSKPITQPPNYDLLPPGTKKTNTKKTTKTDDKSLESLINENTSAKIESDNIKTDKKLDEEILEKIK